MKALVIAPQPFFSPRGTPFSVYYRTLVTAELGVKVDLLTYGEGQEVAIDGVRIIRIPRFGFFGNAKIGPSRLKAFLDCFMFIWSIGLLLRNRYDFVHAHEESVFFCLVLKPLFRFKLVYDMHSSLPQQLTNFKFTQSKLLIGLFKRLEDRALKASDAVITICPALADYVESQQVNRDKHQLIENSIFEPVNLAGSLGSIDAASDDAAFLEDIPANKRLAVYAGTLERYQGIDLLLRAFVYVVEAMPETFLLLVGGTPSQVKHYDQLAGELGISNHCLFTGRVSQQQAQQASARADILLSPRIDGNNTPLKVYELLASGIPFVATDIYSHTQVLHNATCFLVKPDARAFARGMQEALSSEIARNERVQQARQVYEQRYSREVYTRKMQRLIRSLA